MTTELNVADEVISDIAPGLGRKRYDEYKTTGVAWLGEIPNHWGQDRLKWSVEFCRNGTWGSEPDGEHDIICVRVADFDRTRLLVDVSEPTLRSVPPKDRRYRVLRSGDLLLEKSGGGELQPVGAVMIYQHEAEAVCSNFVARMPVVPDADSRYFAYLNSHLYASRVNVRSIKQTTGIQNLDAQSYLDETVPYPPLDEQRAIAAFLDRETAKVDELIAKKRRLIELLKEKRTALISHAVTNGLDPDAKMKDSGIDWVGQVPSHWTILPLKLVAMLQTGLTLGKKYDDAQSLVSRPYLRVANVQDGFLNLDHITHVELPSSNARRYELKQGDMLMTEGGDFDKLGRGYVWNGQIEECLHQNHIFAVRPDSRRLAPHFLACLTSSLHGKAYFTSTSNQTTNLASTNSTKLKNFPVLLPPLVEQESILAHITQISQNHDKLMHATQMGVSTLYEYRSALISAAVTGKIDVREVVSVATARRANVHFHRCVLAAEIVDRHLDTSRFGRVKLQKLLVLAERHLGLDEIQSQPIRAAAGPFDNRMMRAIHAQLKRQKWFNPTKTEHGTTYVPMDKQGGHREYFERYWGDRSEPFDALMLLLKPMKTEQAEIVATLYMAWNDFIIAGEQFTDEQIISEVLNNWDESKQSIEPDRWRTALVWMKEKSLIPFGHGSPTRKGASDAN